MCGHILTFWIIFCDCSFCEDYTWDCEYESGCMYDENFECVNDYCECWGTDVTENVRKALGWAFGVPTFGGTFGFIYWIWKICKTDRNNTRGAYAYHEMDSYY